MTEQPQPPELVTWPCLDYIMRVTEIHEFTSFFFGVIESSDAIADGMKGDSAERFRHEADKYRPDSTNIHRQMVHEVLLSRVVESFNHYVTTILGDIYISKPEMLSTEGEIKVAKVLELRDFEEIVRHLVEKKINEISYSSLADLRKFIKERTKIDLYPREGQFTLALLASEVRNLIAHNDCRVNDIFYRKTGLAAADLPLSETGRYLITDEWLNQVVDCFSSVVFAFDDAIALKFKLERRNRFETFVFRG